MITDWARRTFKWFLEPAAALFAKLHIGPNGVTVIGLILCIIVSGLMATGLVRWAGVLYLISGLADAIDGTLARQLGIRNKFGAFWDSTLDRFGESLVLSSVGVWSALQGDMIGVVISFLALIASYSVSYTRARAEGLGLDCKVGIGTRIERFLILAISMIIGYPVVGLAIITVLASITVIQRIWEVWRLTRPA
ncbi:MAG: CDP-alcohol phosphatidyltransferase family protein [Caldilineales bacterium]|nr:CDP-alcohol phosphatidyltransferase family protein [Caldilineales bacterium]